MKNIEFIEEIRSFIEIQIHNGKMVKSYKMRPDFLEFIKNLHIKVEIDKYKEIILKEETELELGGVNKKSFALVFPTIDFEYIKDNQITLIGPEIESINESEIDFGLFILIGHRKDISEKDYNALRYFNFISDGIEGFMIRSIPRKFWCRISKNIIKTFSLEFFGNALIYLYKEKFKDLIKSIEILFISSYPDLIEEFIEISSKIYEYFDLKWNDKIERWKKRIDCEFDWDCNNCPYIETCEEIKNVLEQRNRINNY